MRDFANLTAYLPNTVATHILSHEMLVPPQVQSFKTTVLFADVSGFTALSEELCRAGPEGTEELAAQLNKYMAQIVKLTSRAGGDVLKFAGDAMFAIWPEHDKLEDSLPKAVQCALDMQARLRNFQFKWTPHDRSGKELGEPKTFSLNVKLGIGAGLIHIMHVGGESDNIMMEKYEYVATGSGLQEAFEAEKYAKMGQVIASKDVVDLLKKLGNLSAADLVPETKGSANKYFIIKEMKGEVRWRNNFVRPTQSTLQDEARVWKYVPAAVLPYLAESNEFWAPELRRVTTLFCNLGFTQEEIGAVSSQDVQMVFNAVQQSVFQFEGTINKFLIDDKGSTLIAVFGLPPFAHENDPTRGVLSAMSILTALKQLGRRGSIGITTGVAFCGVVGTRGNRREYSVIGDPINTSARLMVEAQKRDAGHLMDTETANDVREDLSTVEVGSTMLKGKVAETPLFQVAGGVDAPSMQMARVTGYFAATSRAAQSDHEPTSTTPGPSAKKKKKTEKSDAAAQAAATATIISGMTANDLLKAQKVQIEAITEAPKLRRYRDEAIKARKGPDAKASALVKGMESFVQQTQKGLSMGTGRVRTESDTSSMSNPQAHPAALVISKARAVKAAQIRFENCATGGASAGNLTTTFTLPLIDGIDTFGELKEAALTRLGGRQLLRRGPNADRELFVLSWYNPQQTSVQAPIPDSEIIDGIKDAKPMITLLLTELSEKPAAPSAPPRRASSTISGGAYAQNAAKIGTKKDLVKSQLENVRDALLNGERGRIVVLEGAHGVGKSRTAVQVMFRPGMVNDVLTGVAMGNPYELAQLNLAKAFSVWTVLLKQLVEEALVRRGLQPIVMSSAGAVGEALLELQERGRVIKELLKEAILAFDPTFTRFEFLETIIASFEPTAFVRSSVQPSPRTQQHISTASQKLAGSSAMASTMASVICGLAMISAPVLVIIDDSHFMDAGSWAVTLRLAEMIQAKSSRVLVMLLHRALILAEAFASKPAAGESSEPEDQSVDVLAGVDRHNMRAIENHHTAGHRILSKYYQQLLTMDDVVLHVEKRPDPSATKEIICDTLSADDCNQVLVDIIEKKSGGNALYIRDAMKLYLKHGIVTVKNRNVALTESYHERNKFYDLPVPASVEGICATLLDIMSTTQQIALKVAAMIGETFTLSLVKAVFPIPAFKGGLEGEWEALVRLGVVTETGLKGVAAVQQEAPGTPARPKTEMVYSFGNGWMLETLRKRMLEKQSRKLTELYRLVVHEREAATRATYIAQSMTADLTRINSWMFVRKEHARNMLKPWKKRWVALESQELVQYYDPDNKKRLEVIRLDIDDVSVHNRPGGYMGMESNFGERHFAYCFMVHASRGWIKKGVEQNEPRDFYFCPETAAELQNWLFKINFQIDVCKAAKAKQELGQKLQLTAEAADPLLPGRSESAATIAHAQTVEGEVPEQAANALVTDSNDLRLKALDPESLQSSVAGMPLPSSEATSSSTSMRSPSVPNLSLLSKVLTTGRKSISAVTAPSGSALTPKMKTKSSLPQLPRSPRAATAPLRTDDVALEGTEFQNPGQRIVPMSATHFKAISRDDALASFWASDETTMDDVLVVRASHHVTWFYEFGDMALVSLNGRGAIDGYLLGFISQRTPDHACIHQCAVVPSVRRHKVATKLYTRFGELAAKRKCRYLRSLVERDNISGIAFHRGLGFDELSGEEDRLRDLGNEVIVFIKSI